MKEVKAFGSVRVDLLGGTLDLPPINLILPHVVTLNLATSLKAEVVIRPIVENGVRFISKDYNQNVFFHSEQFCEEQFRAGTFKELQFMARILYACQLTQSTEVEMTSGSPPGAGLGGSSAMGVTLLLAIRKYLGKGELNDSEKHRARQLVQNMESCILDCGPAGYQDYYPALYGGILALLPSSDGVTVEQCFTPDLKRSLEDHLILMYTGETRLSGINNWEVYKAFFDKEPAVRRGLGELAELSYQALQSIKKKDYSILPSLIKAEGQCREKLFKNIVTPSMRETLEEVQKIDSSAGLKVCGAGGGGCFLIICQPQYRKNVENVLKQKTAMKLLPFEVQAPLGTGS